MNKKLLMMATVAIAMATMTSCSPRMTAGGTAAAEIVDSYTGSVNDVNLEISSEPRPARSSYDEQKCQTRQSTIHTVDER